MDGLFETWGSMVSQSAVRHSVISEQIEGELGSLKCVQWWAFWQKIFMHESTHHERSIISK